MNTDTETTLSPESTKPTGEPEYDLCVGDIDVTSPVTFGHETLDGMRGNRQFRDETESDLTHNWLVPILDDADRQHRLRRRWEKNNQNGRCDLALGYEGREVCIVETKRRTVNDLAGHLLQAHRYAFSQNYWRDGKLVPPLGILTNGQEAIVFDGGSKYSESVRSRQVIELTNDHGVRLLKQIFTNLSEGKLGHPLHSPPKVDGRNLVVEELTCELLGFYEDFKETSERNAFEYMLQLFLVAVLRDCGFIPTGTMQIAFESGNWAEISSLLNIMLASNFIPLPNGRDSVVQQVYQETRTLCARLDQVPPDCLGLVYESVLHRLTGKGATTTYYTPHELAGIVIRQLAPTPEEVFLDPSCGSGTFLTGVIEYLALKDPDFRDPKNMFSYVTGRLRGIDRDRNACSVAKAMVLATIASHLDFDPASRELRLPNLKNTIIHDDLFLHDTRPSRKADVVAGNLPWGHIDGKRKDNVIDPEVRRVQRIEQYETFYRNADVSSLALEHILNTLLNRKGRLGLLVKQQSLHGTDASKKFVPYARMAGITFWDYDDRKWFANSASMTAIAWFGTGQKEFIVNKSDGSQFLAEHGPKLSEFGRFFRGFQPSKTWIWKAAAERPANASLLKKLYPDNVSVRHFLLPKQLDSIVFVRPGTDPPSSFVESLTEDERHELRTRVQVAKPYAYRGVEGFDYYKFDGRQMRIVFPQFSNEERMFAMIDERGEAIGTDSHTIFIPHDGCPAWQVWSILGWLNVRFFRDELKRIRAKRLGPKRFGVYPTKLNELARIPAYLCTPEFGTWVHRSVKDGATPEHIESEILRLAEVSVPRISETRLKSARPGVKKTKAESAEGQEAKPRRQQRR